MYGGEGVAQFLPRPPSGQRVAHMGGGAAPELGGAGAGGPEGGRAGVINTPLANPSHTTGQRNLSREKG